MLIRYGTSKSGKRVPIAEIYTKKEHGIEKNDVDPDAVKITERLNSKGYDVYIVGGAVRDLLIGRKPKDFDIATNASPKEIKKVFWNARIIGRRFRLVHLYFSRKIIEVSTFRSGQDGNNNVYGTIDDDVKRRDFSINALYYEPQSEYILDFVHGYKDIRKGRLRSLIPLDSTFAEDPVRMIRGIKYAATTGFKIPFKLKRSIIRYRSELQRCSSSRLTEEVLKILLTGASRTIFEMLIDYKLLEYILPVIYSLVAGHKITYVKFLASLSENDKNVLQHHETRKGRLIAGLVQSLIMFPNDYENTTMLFHDIFKEIKHLISPLTPPNQEVEMAVVKLFRNEGLIPPKNAVRKKRPPLDKKTPPRQKHHDMNRYYKK